MESSEENKDSEEMYSRESNRIVKRAKRKSKALESEQCNPRVEVSSQNCAKKR